MDELDAGNVGVTEAPQAFIDPKGYAQGEVEKAGI